MSLNETVHPNDENQNDEIPELLTYLHTISEPACEITEMDQQEKNQYNSDLIKYKEFLATNSTELTGFKQFRCQLYAERLTKLTGLLWFVGLPSNGKSTISGLIKELYGQEEAFKYIRAQNENIQFI